MTHDPFNLDVPFGRRYYKRPGKRKEADRVARLLRAAKTFREAGRLAVRVCGVDPAKVKAVLETEQSNAVRMMNLARACRDAVRASNVSILWPPYVDRP